jgi:tRNA(Arg) A34 adenosine deaminase TadA
MNEAGIEMSPLYSFLKDKMNRHEKHFQEANLCSKVSPYHRYKIGSVLVLKSGKKYYGFNQGKSHPLQEKFSAIKKRKKLAKAKNSFLHAEMHAIISALRDCRRDELEGASIYVYRTPNNKKPFAMCRPCLSCLAAIKYYKIEHIYYTTDESDFVYERMTIKK